MQTLSKLNKMYEIFHITIYHSSVFPKREG